MRSIVLMLLLNVVLVGCGGGGNSANPADNQKVFPTKAELIEAMNNSSVSCGERSLNCPDNVAKLTFWFQDGDKFNLGVCSGTLFNNDYILTNSHCIPSNLRNGDACSGQIKIQFPETQSSLEESVKCSRVVQVFENYSKYYNNPDLAVLKVEARKNITPSSVTTAKNSFYHNQSVYAYTMNPGNDLKGTIKRKECSVSLDNLYETKTTSNNEEALISGRNCHVIGGNSGSGLFDQSGRLIGAINKSVDIGQLGRLFRRNGINFEALSYMGKFVNLGCLNSLTSASGSGCISGPTPMKIDQYLDSKKSDQGFAGISDYDIEAIITSDLGIRLTRATTSTRSSHTLASLRTKLASISSNVTLKIIFKDLK